MYWCYVHAAMFLVSVRCLCTCCYAGYYRVCVLCVRVLYLFVYRVCVRVCEVNKVRGVCQFGLRYLVAHIMRTCTPSINISLKFSVRVLGEGGRGGGCWVSKLPTYMYTTHCIGIGILDKRPIVRMYVYSIVWRFSVLNCMPFFVTAQKLNLILSYCMQFLCLPPQKKLCRQL